jgi:hypothetical protein
MSESVRDAPQDPVNIGRYVRYWGEVWKIADVNYTGSYTVQRTYWRDGERWRSESSCVLGLDHDHPHFAELISDAAVTECPVDHCKGVFDMTATEQRPCLNCECPLKLHALTTEPRQ